MRRALSAFVAAALLAACGSSVYVEPSGTGLEAGGGGGSAPGGAGGAGWTPCSSPHGYAICNGSHHCSSCVCNPADPISECDDATYAAWSMNQGIAECPECREGGICVQSQVPRSWWCEPWDVGVLYAENGFASRVRYADFGLWTGEAIPDPATCPHVDGLPLCGGACGGCPGGQTCNGRGPLHPYGLCLAHGPATDYFDACGPGSVDGHCTKGRGLGCFTYAVQPAAQKVAEAHGVCLPLEMCERAAASLPGGGTCAP